MSSQDKVAELKMMLRNTNDDEIDCAEFFEMMGSLAETPFSLDLPELKRYLHHIEMCVGCREEFELLKVIVQG